jgi:hypothetical protein
MKNIFQVMEKHQQLIIVLISLAATVYFGYQIFTIILNHISTGATATVIPNFDTISKYFKL